MKRSFEILGYVMAAAAPLLSGCASTNTVLSETPEEILHSPRSPAEISACFAAKGGRLIEREDGALVLRFRNGYGGVVRAFSIYPEGAGSRIEKRSHGPGVPGMRWKKCMAVK